MCHQGRPRLGVLNLEGEEGCGGEGLSLVEIGFEVVHNGVWIGFGFEFWAGLAYMSRTST